MSSERPHRQNTFLETTKASYLADGNSRSGTAQTILENLSMIKKYIMIPLEVKKNIDQVHGNVRPRAGRYRHRLK